MSWFASKRKVKEHNVYWVMNEELNRLHRLLGDWKASENISMAWYAIADLHKSLKKICDKVPDADLQRDVADIQDKLVTDMILKDDKKD